MSELMGWMAEAMKKAGMPLREIRVAHAPGKAPTRAEIMSALDAELEAGRINSHEHSLLIGQAQSISDDTESC